MTTEVLDHIKKLDESLGERFSELAAKSDAAMAAIEKGETVSTSLKTSIENTKGEVERLAEQVQELQQKGVPFEGKTGKSFIDMVQEDPSVQSFKNNQSPSWKKEFVKSELDALLDTKADTSNLRSETVDSSILVSPRTQLSIRDLIPTIQISSTDYTYFKENSHTLAAGMVAEGGTKPQQDADFEEITDTVKKIAVWHRVTMEQLQDYPQVVSYIRDLLNYDIKLKEEEQILKGDGTGANLNGLLTQAAAYDATVDGVNGAQASDTSIDTIRRMIYQLRKQDKSSPDAIVMTDKSWMNIELQKDNNNAFLFANIQGIATPLLWGRRVVVSDALDDSTEEVMVANFNRAARIYDRMQYMVKAGLINDDFIKNQSVILAEERIGLGVWRPNAIVKHTLGA
ncbi:MAG: phage major capsid protein [Pseudomonadota bacterium]|nr:phage major capsid protein [Pseudomonadota bacterium]